MKSLKLLAASLLLFGACKQDLEVEPVNQYLSENFYQTEEQVFASLIAAYDPIGWSMAMGQWISPVMLGEIRSDNANAGGDASNNDQPAWQELDDFRETNTNTILQPIYRKNYIGIFRANLVILEPELESANIDRYQAEARFLRAYYHFELFRHFGPVPVIDRLLTPDEVGLERSSMDELFTLIKDDLKAAIEVLPTTLSENELGRASRGAAQALLGKAYLYWADLDNDDAEKFGLAAQYLQDVVDSRQYQLEDDFANLFAYETENSPEAVLEIQHSNLWPSDWGWFEGIEGNGIIQLCGIRGLCSDYPEYSAGWGFLLPTADLNDHFLSDDDYRRDAAIISLSELEETVTNEGIAGCGVVVDLSENNPSDYTGFWQQKYANYKEYEGNNINGGDPNLTKDGNTYAIRYADVLLMLAEAIHRSGGADAQALEYINLVRERAAGPGDNTGSFRTAQQLMADTGWSLQDVIWYERRAELAGEGDRWYDLVRSGRVSNDLFDAEKASNLKTESIWLPISLEETSVATKLSTYPETELFN
ncbi:RagB/SusD family nutrient uptake outer membrane protein [Marinoscillum furvescens]|uniref:Putative outer membrane starch-binding protein n=1 Tax=Marinoscillum furvescens DSM 4134 TaxID=1122208 RepID=A0A3D9L1Y6_MARFU|nr:RagB/SusD family nutrient uptake outer membrane protein [Marinoscillum furvescens]RED97404.1 putative outer membrane starch-binding protein [Marinoscillum furvescens DSM 4134]